MHGWCLSHPQTSHPTFDCHLPSQPANTSLRLVTELRVVIILVKIIYAVEYSKRIGDRRHTVHVYGMDMGIGLLEARPQRARGHK